MCKSALERSLWTGRGTWQDRLNEETWHAAAGYGDMCWGRSDTNFADTYSSIDVATVECGLAGELGLRRKKPEKNKQRNTNTIGKRNNTINNTA